jgi:hypothetical protein
MTPTKRLYTVTNRNRENGGPVPELRMSGKWLGVAGFAPGSLLSVCVTDNRLVVTVVARPRPLLCRRCAKARGEE